MGFIAGESLDATAWVEVLMVNKVKLSIKRLFFLALITFTVTSYAASPNCSGVDNWAARMSFVHLKNAGFLNSQNIDLKKTKVELIVSKEVSKGLYRQIHLVTFEKKSGEVIKVITINDASIAECSMSAVNVYVISERLGG